VSNEQIRDRGKGKKLTHRQIELKVRRKCQEDKKHKYTQEEREEKKEKRREGREEREEKRRKRRKRRKPRVSKKAIECKEWWEWFWSKRWGLWYYTPPQNNHTHYCAFS